MAERRDRLNDPDEALKAIHGARTNAEITAVLLVTLLMVVLAVVSVRLWLL